MQSPADQLHVECYIRRPTEKRYVTKQNPGQDPRVYCRDATELIDDGAGGVAGVRTVAVEWSKGPSGRWCALAKLLVSGSNKCCTQADCCKSVLCQHHAKAVVCTGISPRARWTGRRSSIRPRLSFLRWASSGLRRTLPSNFPSSGTAAQISRPSTANLPRASPGSSPPETAGALLAQPGVNHRPVTSFSTLFSACPFADRTPHAVHL